MFHSLGPLTANELSYSVWLLDELDRERDGTMARVPCLEVSVNLISQQLGTTLLRIFHIIEEILTQFCQDFIEIDGKLTRYLQ